MIYITGDTHGDRLRFLEYNIGDTVWTEKDYLIICGDFGFIWYGSEDTDGKQKNDTILNMLARKPYTILWIDGNHENFDELNKYPEVFKYNNTVHKIRDNIYHLQRGRIYEIEGKTFFALGGTT